MKYPFISTSLSILLWLGFIVLFVSSSQNQEQEYALEVDASIVDEMVRQSVKSHKNNDEIGEEKSAENSDAVSTTTAKITARPLPQIPDELRKDAFESYAIARFYVSAQGETRVELIKPCSNPKLNSLLLKSLRKWQFAPAMKNGVAIDSIQDVRVDFKVE